MLRVGTGQKALRAVGGRFFVNCGRAREKLTGWNTPPAVRKRKGLRNSREEPPHPRWRKEAGGGARGKLSPREATPSHPANKPRFLSKDFLRPDRRRARGPQREKARRTRGECAQASGCLNRSGPGRHKLQAQLNPRFCGVPENWNCTQRRARSIQSSREPEQFRQPEAWAHSPRMRRAFSLRG